MTYEKSQKKKSDFTTDDLITNASTLDYVKEGVNKKTSWSNLLDKIGDVYGASLRMFDTESELVASDIRIGEHAIVVENGYTLYSIGNLAASTGDVTLASGYVATFRDRHQTEYDDYTELRGLKSSAIPDGTVIKITNDGIAGDFVAKTGANTDNGGTIIQAGDDVNRYYERVYGDDVNIRWFGAIPNDTSAGTTNYNAISSAMLVANDAGTVMFPHVSGGIFSFYYINRPIEISATSLNVRAVSLSGSDSELVFLRPSNDFVGDYMIALFDADGNNRWGNKIKNLVITGKKPDSTFLDYVFYMRDSSLISFIDSYFEGSAIANVRLDNSFGYEFVGCTFEDSAAHFLFENNHKIGRIKICTFNGGSPFSYSSATGYIEVSENRFNSLSGGISCDIMTFRDNVIRNPNGSSSSPVIAYRGLCQGVFNNTVVYTDGRSSNCTSVVRIDSANNEIINCFNNAHDGTAPLIAYTNQPYNKGTPIKFTQDEVSSSNYTITYTSGTNTIQGTRSASGFVRYMQDGKIKLSTPTNPTQAFTVPDDNSLVYDFADSTFKVVTTTDLTEYQVEIAIRVDGWFHFTCEDLFKRDSTNFSAGRIFAYDDRYP